MRHGTWRQLSQNRSTIAASMRKSAAREGAFSSRDMVGCEHSGPPPARRSSAESHLEQRVGAQDVAVVGVVIPGGDGEHPEADHLGHRVIDAQRIAGIAQACRQTVADPKPALDLAQQQDPGIRGWHPTIERRLDLLAFDR